MSSLETVVFRRGDVVFAEGDSVDESPYMYIIGSGKVQQRFLSAPDNCHATTASLVTNIGYCWLLTFPHEVRYGRIT